MQEQEYDRSVRRGVVVEFDFTALDGASLLFETAKETLRPYGVELTRKLEALHLAGGNYHGGMRELFAAVGCGGEASKAAGELSEAFKAKLAEKVSGAVNDDFRRFVEALTGRGVKVVAATRAAKESVQDAFAEFEGPCFTLYHETSNTYGNCKWDAWKRACTNNGLVDVLSVAVAGSGNGVKSSLMAGLSAVAVIHGHVAYQDFGGADAYSEVCGASLAADIARMLHV